MKQTVADLLEMKRPDPRYAVEAVNTVQAEGPSYGGFGGLDKENPQIFTVRVIMHPGEVEILDGKLVYEKRVLARNSSEAINKSGVIDARRS